MADLSKDTKLLLLEYRRMCRTYPNCTGCGLVDAGCSLNFGDDEVLDDIIKETQRWHDAHPQKTYAQDFLEKNPKFLRNPENKRHPCVCRAKAYEGVSTCTHELYRSVFECEKCWDEPMLDDE